MAIDHSAVLGTLPEPHMLFGDTWITTGDNGSVDINDPSNGGVIGTLPIAGERQVAEAVAAATAGQAAWIALSPSKRRDAMIRLADLLVKHSVELATISAVEAGLPGPVQYGRFAAEWFRYYAGWTEKIHGKVIPSYPVNAFAYTVGEPYGVVAMVTPFNVSMGAIGMKVAPAIAAGNSVIIKPPAQTPLQTVLFARLCLEAGFPPGVVNVIQGNRIAGDLLVRHPGVAKISLTGGLSTATSILNAAAETARPVATELGGKSACLAFEEGPWQAAADLAAMNACVNNNGQGCMFPTRLLVESTIYDRVIEHVTSRLSSVAIGDPLDPATRLGPVISEDAVNRIMSMIDVAKGDSRLVIGGERLGGDLTDGYFIAPTVFADVDNSSPLGQNEVFGPVLAISKFETEDEAVAMANDTNWGLAAYAYTNDLQRALRLARSLQAGTVGINGMTTVPANLPFGGYKSSGVGREGGEEGLREFLQTKTVYMPLLAP